MYLLEQNSWNLLRHWLSVEECKLLLTVAFAGMRMEGKGGDELKGQAALQGSKCKSSFRFLPLERTFPFVQGVGDKWKLEECILHFHHKSVIIKDDCYCLLPFSLLSKK